MEAPRLVELPISVLVCEPEESPRATLRAWLVAAGCSVSEGTRAPGAAGARSPDVVLFGLGPDPVRDLRSLAAIWAADARARVVVLHSAGQEPAVLEALRRGARGHLGREGLDAEHLLAALRLVAGGEALISPRVAGLMLDAVREKRKCSRERRGELV